MSVQYGVLRTGQTAGIFSPSSSVTPDAFPLGLDVFHSLGFKTIIHPQTYVGRNDGSQYAGSPEDKASALMDLWTDDRVDILLVSCGGNFASQILPLLDFETLKAAPKPIMGFSDTTALLSAFYAKGISGGIFGSTLQTFRKLEKLDDITTVLEGHSDTIVEMPLLTPLFKDTKTSQAPLFAATLSVLLSLAGTPYFPDLRGHILFLEDIGEELSHLDRALWQLNQICPFETLAGLCFGEFVAMKDTGRPIGDDFEGILRKHTQKAAEEKGIPVFTGGGIGHGTVLTPIQLGRMGKLDATKRCLILE